MDRWLGWREAMTGALYGPDGFFVRPGPGPAGHFRTSAHASPLFAAALLRLLARLDDALGRPDPLQVVDVGAGRGELLTALVAAAPPPLAERLRPIAVELAPAEPVPWGSPRQPPRHEISWSASLPAPITGLLLATEWLDNVPVDVAELDDHGVPRQVLVDPASGEETLGDPVAGPAAQWLARWWPLTHPGSRAEIGHPRDLAWAEAVSAVDRGAALAVDYGHETASRPWFGSLTGYRAGRQVAPVPDGSCDLTAHVAVDAVADAGAFALHTRTHTCAALHTPAALHTGAQQDVACCAPVCRANAVERYPSALVRQSTALATLGISGARPPHALAARDPGDYLRRLVAAGAAAELTDPAGLGGHYWLLQPVNLPAAANVTGWLT